MIDEHKICFITCVNDERMYEESLLYLQHLSVPAAMNVEFIAVCDAVSMAAAYNQAMRQTDARYKVYLHQDVLIIRKTFIEELILIFERDRAVGMLGIIGSDKLDFYGVWWQSKGLIGAIYDDHGVAGLQADIYRNDELMLMAAQNIDGVLMATQYDLPWQEEIFDGWHFYDGSQCREFIKAAYKVAVIAQQQPWCVHLCGTKILGKDYDKYRMKFLLHYQKSLYPLVSILIPTYNRVEYFKIALESALRQTYPRIEIVVCDNSTDERTATLMQNYQQDKRVRYFRNSLAKTKQENFQPFAQLAKGEYIQWLMDDDVLAAEKIERMMQCFWNSPDVTVATSCRQWIDATGAALLNKNQLQFEEKEECSIIKGEVLGKKILLTMSNLVGEPSVFLFRRADLTHHYWQANCKGYQTISDIAMSLELLEKGNCVYFQAPLSSYRRHSGQEGQQGDVIIRSRLEWLQLFEEYYARRCFICTEAEYKQAMAHWCNDAAMVVRDIDPRSIQDTALFNKYKQKIADLIMN